MYMRLVFLVIESKQKHLSMFITLTMFIDINPGLVQSYQFSVLISSEFLSQYSLNGLWLCYFVWVFISIDRERHNQSHFNSRGVRIIAVYSPLL